MWPLRAQYRTDFTGKRVSWGVERLGVLLQTFRALRCRLKTIMVVIAPGGYYIYIALFCGSHTLRSTVSADWTLESFGIWLLRLRLIVEEIEGEILEGSEWLFSFLLPDPIPTPAID